MSKELSFGKTAMDKVLVGLYKTADAVTGTLGPRGKNVMIEDSILPHITNDGSTIAESISFPDKYENLGAWVVKNTCSQTNEDVGDGTTTTAVLLKEIIRLSLTRPESPMVIKNSLKNACDVMVENLKDMSTPITMDDIKKVALISSESEEIANIVCDVFQKVGEKGTIVVEESKTFETSTDVQEGYECNNGFVNAFFSNDGIGAVATYENIPVLCSAKKISTVMDVKPLFEQLDNSQIGEIVVVAADFDATILGVFANTKARGGCNILPIKVVGTQLEDICATVGATMISDETGVQFKNLNVKEHLGSADKVVANSKKSLFIAKTASGQELANRLKEQAEVCENLFEKAEIKKRIAKLTGGIAVIKIGGTTDLDRVYKKHKTDDTVAAVKAALEEGIVEGGGMALWRTAQDMQPMTVGEIILKEALTAPLRTICENADKKYEEVVIKMPAGMGYNAKDDIYCKMIESEIIDPTKVERVSLENAVSNSSVFITTHCVVVDAKIEK